MKPAQAKGLIASIQDRYQGIKVVYANKGEVGDPDTLTGQAISGMDDQSHVRLKAAQSGMQSQLLRHLQQVHLASLVCVR